MSVVIDTETTVVEKKSAWLPNMKTEKLGVEVRLSLPESLVKEGDRVRIVVYRED